MYIKLYTYVYVYIYIYSMVTKLNLECKIRPYSWEILSASPWLYGQFIQPFFTPRRDTLM